MDDMGGMNLRPVRKPVARSANAPNNIVSLLTRERLRRYMRAQSDRAQEEFARQSDRFGRMAETMTHRLATQPADAEAQARRLAARLTIALLAAERAARRALAAGDAPMMERVHAQMTRLAHGAILLDQRFRRAGVAAPTMLARRAIASLDRMEHMANGAGVRQSPRGLQVSG